MWILVSSFSFTFVYFGQFQKGKVLRDDFLRVWLDAICLMCSYNFTVGY